MFRSLALLPPCMMLLAACTGTPRRAEFSGGYPLHDCPGQLDGQVRLQAEIRPIEMHASALRESSIATTGSLGRRIVVSVVPAGLRPDDRIIWSTLTIASYGGTFLGWDRLQTNSGLTSPSTDAPSAQRKRLDEIVTVTLAPGQVKIARAVRGKTDLAGMHSIDVLLMPGGVAVDDAFVRIPKLWQENGKPLSAAAVTPELVPVRHPPGLDAVEASFQLDFVVRLGKGGDEWSCSAETRAILVDKDALRQPFWDLGLASSNSSRREWLGAFDPALGGVRLVFDSPMGANALADWLRTTRSTRLGSYELGVFRPSNRPAGRPFGSIGGESLQTFRPLADGDIDAIAVGPVGEP